MSLSSGVKLVALFAAASCATYGYAQEDDSAEFLYGYWSLEDLDWPCYPCLATYSGEIVFFEDGTFRRWGIIAARSGDRPPDYSEITQEGEFIARLGSKGLITIEFYGSQFHQTDIGNSMIDFTERFTLSVSTHDELIDQDGMIYTRVQGE